MGWTVRRSLYLALVLIAGALLLLGVLNLMEAGSRGGVQLFSSLALLAIGLAGLWAAHTLLDDHFAELERLRGDLGVSATAGTPLPPHWKSPVPGPEVRQLAAAAAELAILAGKVDAHAVEDALAKVMSAVPDGVVLVTDRGLLSLINGSARARLGAGRVEIGTSIFEFLDRASLSTAMVEAQRAQGPVAVVLATTGGARLPATVVDLGERGGVAICLTSTERAGDSRVDHYLGLHQMPPSPEPVTDGTRLDALPVAIIDAETTGLDVVRDRIVALAAVRMHGPRIYANASFDRLVDPEMSIPSRASAIHGIEDSMVRQAEKLPGILPGFMDFVRGTVLVGHNLSFDLALLRNGARRSELGWVEPPWLCTARLAASLWPDLPSVALDALALRLGVEIRGRHTALGDALVTAEIYAALLPLLTERGIVHLGEARDFAAQAVSVVRRDREAGWLDATPG